MCAGTTNSIDAHHDVPARNWQTVEMRRSGAGGGLLESISNSAAR